MLRFRSFSLYDSDSRNIVKFIVVERSQLIRKGLNVIHNHTAFKLAHGDTDYQAPFFPAESSLAALLCVPSVKAAKIIHDRDG